MEGRVSSIDDDVRITISRSHPRIHFLYSFVKIGEERAWAAELCN